MRIGAGACAALLITWLVGGGIAGAAGASDPVAHASIGFEPSPLSLATDAAGHVFLSNPQRSARIDEYSPDGTFLAALGSFGLSSGFEARDIATDTTGDLWVADGVARKVVELAGGGKVLGNWNMQGRAIAVSSGGVYTAGPTEVERFSPTGTPMRRSAPIWCRSSARGQA